MVLLAAGSDDSLGPGAAVIGMIGGAVAFLWGLYQYTEAQKWKRLEFVAKEIKEYEGDRAVQLVFQMLDWKIRRLPLFDEEPLAAPGSAPTPGGAGEPAAPCGEVADPDPPPADTEGPAGTRDARWVVVSWEKVSAALEPHEDRDGKPGKTRFTPAEARIRDLFDRFLDHWNRFGHYIQTGLVEYGDCHPYLEYWLRAIGTHLPDARRSEFQRAVQRYIDRYYRGTGVDVLLRASRTRL